MTSAVALPPTEQVRTSKAAIAASVVGVFICLLDTNIVNVALPDIQRALGGGISASQWIVSLYVLALAALIVPAGILGDLRDIRVLYGVGGAVFGLGSLACTLAASSGTHGTAMIFVGRAVQGVGAALILPLSLAMIFVFAEPAARTKLIALWSAVGGLSTAVGPLVGGLIVQHIGWTWIFLINLPVVAVLVALLLRTPAPGGRRREALPSPVSVAAFAVSTFALTLALIQGPSWGWADVRVLAMFGLTLVGTVVFVAGEAGSKRPLVPVTLRREREFRSSLLTGFVSGFAVFSLFFFLSYYLQYGAGLSPTATGLHYLPMSAMLVVFAGAGRKVGERIGQAATIGVGMLICGIGLTLLWVMLADSRPGALATIVPTVVLGIGVGLSFPATSAQAFAHTSGDDYGTAASILTMTRQLGTSVGIGVLSLIMTRSVGQHLTADAVRDGLRWIGLAGAVATTLIALVNLRAAARNASNPESESE